MQVAKWGNSLAVRLPAALAQALDCRADYIIVFYASLDEYLASLSSIVGSK